MTEPSDWMKYHPDFPNIDDVFIFYDRPILFTYHDGLGIRWLVQLEDGDDESETWMLVAVKDARWQKILDGEIDLHDAFAKAETGHVFLQTTFFRDLPKRTVMLNAATLPDDRLAVRGASLAKGTRHD